MKGMTPLERAQQELAVSTEQGELRLNTLEGLSLARAQAAALVSIAESLETLASCVRKSNHFIGIRQI